MPPCSPWWAQADVGIGSLRTCAAVRDWSEVRVWSRTQATLDAFMESEAPRHPGLMLKPSTDLEAVVRGADAVVTTTTGADPVVRDEWIVRRRSYRGAGLRPRRQSGA